MKRTWMMMAALVVFGLLTAAVGAAEKGEKGGEKGGDKAKDPNKVAGQVVKFEGNDLTIKVRKENVEKVIKVTDTTAYATMNGKDEAAATKDAVTAGKMVAIQLAADGSATKVMIMPAKAPGDKPAGEKPKKGDK